jgi:neamine transaminase/2'-deamino-2'-hydroxyneamine transaminase/neomycin C transaminase
LQVLADRIKHEGHRVAAVVVSVDLNLGRDWYERLQAVVQDSDIPLVLDEVKSGFRYRHGLLVGGEIIDCAAWVVSKGIANGAPIAAVGGDRKLLAAIRDMTYTSFFEPVCLAAAEATLSLLQSGTVQATVLANGNAFIEHARTVLNAADVPIEIVGAGPMFQFVCANEEIEWEFYAAASRARLMFYEGDHQAPSAALSGETLTTACDRFDRAVSDLAGRWSGVEVTRESRYQGAWNEMCGLPDFPRTPEETQAWARTLLGF